MLNSIPNLRGKGKSTELYLDTGWKALGQKGDWAGPWITNASKGTKAAYPNVYTIYKVSTTHSDLGGSHFILQMPGQSNFYDPRTGNMINSFNEVSGYKTGTIPIDNQVAF